MLPPSANNVVENIFNSFGFSGGKSSAAINSAVCLASLYIFFRRQ